MNAAAMATAWMDTLWDPERRLLRSPDDRTHMVRETAWYALGLLARADRDRAVTAIDSVLTYQFDAPGRPYHGTWRRAPDEPEPPAHAAEWRDYDPNWREFIGCALLLVLRESPLPSGLTARIDRALSLATDGARARAVPPSYTNIALMGAFLFDAVGQRHRIAGLRRAGEALGQQVYDDWRRTFVFPEFNSPTYYGVDLFALALWRARAPSAVLRRLGAEMERRLWREIATRYHPGLRNMAGPFDRAYGMDMRRYLALLGLWIAPVVDHAPLPDRPEVSEHAADWCFAPCVALLGAPDLPADVAARLRSLPGEEYVTTPIAPRRVATSWLGPYHIVGAQDAAGTRNDADEQYCPVAVYWRGPDGVNWLRLAPRTPADARVDESGILHVSGRLRFEAHAPRTDPRDVTAAEWRLPGLTVRLSPVEDLAVAVTRAGDILRIEYTPSPATLDLHVSAR